MDKQRRERGQTQRRERGQTQRRERARRSKPNNRADIAFISMVVLYVIIYAIRGWEGIVGTGPIPLYDTIFHCTVSILTFAMYIAAVKKPILSLSLLFTVQAMQFIYDRNLGLEASGIELIYVVIIFMVLAVRVIKALKNTEAKSKTSISDKISAVLLKDGRMGKLSVYAHIIVWSLFITIVSMISQSGMIADYGLNNGFNVHAALSVVLPIFILGGVLTTSEFLLEVLILNEVVEVYTVCMMWVVGIVSVYQVLAIIPGIVTLVMMSILKKKE